MNKPLLLALAAAALLGTNANALSMYDRIQAMENEMNSLKKEIISLRAESTVAEDTEEEVESDEEAVIDEESDEESEEESDEDEEESDPEEQISDIEESIAELTRSTSGSHLKFGVDYRFAIDNLNYTMADGSTAANDAFMTNRLWINTFWKATDTLSFRAQLAYNKAFGQRSGASDPTSNQAETFDWIASENPYDDTLRVKSAYFFYKNDTFIGTDIPWTFSIGRRPSTNGHLINFRDDDHASSPLAHLINVEFDGLSSKFVLNESTNTSIKFCGGRGQTNATAKFTATPYDTDENSNDAIDLGGVIVVPYNDGQYSLNTMYFYANNLIDLVNPMDQTAGFATVGGLHGATANLTINGIGNEINDFLDETIFFVSGAWTKTDPDADQGMLGSDLGESKTGYSYWIGTQFPSFTEDGRIGLEFNHGSKYFRSITYAEDTMAGSKIATRGNAFEAYMTEYLVEDILSLQLRYTYIDYEFSGSNGFFGNTTGTAISMDDAVAFEMGNQVVDTAQDIRFYLRYKY